MKAPPLDKRRGEVNFVASRVGRSTDPKECLGLARQLGVEVPTALGYLILWEEFILEAGDGATGRLHGYTAAHIAAKLCWRGRPEKLIRALQDAGVLRRQRGTYLHAYWSQSITGHYARTRVEDREYWRVKKREQRDRDRLQALSERDAVPEMSTGHPGDVPGDKGDSPLDGGHKERKDIRTHPPDPPQSGGGSVGRERWRWIREHHKYPVNSGPCARYLEAMTPEDWALCQYVVLELARPGGGDLSLKKRVRRLNSHKFLATEAYLQFQREWAEKQRPREIGELVARIEDVEQERRGSGRAFLLARLADPELTETERARARRQLAELYPEAVEVAS